MRFKFKAKKTRKKAKPKRKGKQYTACEELMNTHTSLGNGNYIAPIRRSDY